MKLVLQNLQLDGKMLVYKVIKPFDTIVQANDSQTWLTGQDDYRTRIRELGKYIWSKENVEKIPSGTVCWGRDAQAYIAKRPLGAFR